MSEFASSSLSERAQLRERQRVVLDDLLAGRAPAGFDPTGTSMTTRVLHHKRSSAALGVAPELADLPQWRERFHAWAARHPQVGCAHDDVAAFVATVADAPGWRRLHEVYEGRKRAGWVQINGRRAVAIGLGSRVWRFTFRRTPPTDLDN